MTRINRVKRNFLKLLGLGTLLPKTGVGAAGPVEFTLAFGSCLHQDKPQPVWDAVLENRPNLFVFLGDNIYGDSDDPDVLAAKYRQLADKPGFQRLRASTEIMAIWDDHDYGRNDAGAEYEAKAASRRLMLEFWGEALESPRWQQGDGIYTARMLEQSGRQLHIILPDLRWNRSPVRRVTSPQALVARELANMGPYRPTDDSQAVLLGESQWQWLEAEFEKSADVRLFGSSIQVLAETTGWEAWANFPHERQRLLDLIVRHQEVPTLLLSGDVHWCELSQLSLRSLAWPMLELTSSGLTETWEAISPNQHRVTEAFAQANFGLVKCVWQEGSMTLHLSARDISNRALLEFAHHYPFLP